jgi:hypothetical protein
VGVFECAKLLQQWNDRLLASSLADQLPPDVVARKWLGFPPATDTQIATAERRLGLPLPPSYRAFLSVSNGWQLLNDAIWRVWGTDEIQWFKRTHEDWIAAYTAPSPYGARAEVSDEEYFSYETPQDFRPGHLKESLQISAVGDSAVLLLNPQVISKAGEWEAWFFANWIPGALRYRSFQELFEFEYYRFFNLEWKQPVGIVGGLPDEYTGTPCSPRRHLKKRRHRQAFRVLNKPIDRWDFDELLKLLQHEDWNVRQEAALGLDRLKDRRAIEPLLALVGDDSNACSAAMHALKTLAPDRLREPLLELLRTQHLFGYASAASVLAELRELRAVPILVELVKDTSSERLHYSQIAGKLLAQFGSAGFDALANLLADDNPIIRARAAHSLLYTGDPRTIDLYRKLLSHTDPAIRDAADTGLRVLHAPRESHP